MSYKAWLGPSGGLVPLVGYRGGTTRITLTHENNYVPLAQSFGAVMIHNQSRDATTWFDESGNSLHGTLTNTPVWNATGGPGENIPGYFSFNGTSQIIQIANNALLQFTTAFTLVWWQRSDANAQENYAQIIGKGNEGYQVRLNSLDQTSMTSQVWDGSASYGDASTPTGYLTPFVNTWKMFMFRYDGSNSTLHTIDGSGNPEIVLTDAYALGPEVNTTRFVYAAQDDYGNLRRYWRGDLAGGLAFDTVLTTTQFKSLYDTSIGVGVTPPPPSEGWITNQSVYYDTIVPPDVSADLFVDFDSGSDTNDGTSWAQAYATMEKAATDLNGIGGIVKVRGTRTIASEITITSSGASVGSRIEFWADSLYGAKVDANGATRAIQLNTDYVEINGFEIYDATYVGIRIYKTGDYQTTGAFYNRVRYCYIHDIRWPDNWATNGGSYISAHGPYTEVDSCFIQGSAPIAGDGFDTRMQGIYGRGSWLKITNNLVTNIRAGRGIQLYFSDTSLVIDCEVVGNTVLHCYDGGIQVQAENALVANNILAHNDGPGIRFFGSNSHATIENNLFHNNSTDVLDLAANYTNTSVNGVSGDPGFVNYQADGTGDYKITSSSPAFKSASPTHATTSDYYGNIRESLPTIGFFEVEQEEASVSFSDGIHTFGLEGNESFNPSSPTLKDGTVFTTEMETYYDAFFYGFTNPSADSFNNIVTRLGTGDSYGMGRYGQVAQDPAVSAFRLTGDLRILDHLITAWNGAYSTLTTEFVAPMAGLDSACNPPTDPPWSPYRKWLFSDYGTDTVSLQEIKPRAINLEFVWALHQNVGKTSPAGHNYATELAKWKTVVEEYVKACAEDSTDCWVTGGNYRRVDGGFGGYFGSRQRQSWGSWPIHLRAEGHSVYNSILAQHYLGLLGVNGVGWDIPNPSGALTSATEIEAVIDTTNRIDDLDDYGRPKIITKWTTLGSTDTIGVEALRATYTSYQAWSLLAMKMTGVWDSTLTDETLLRLSRAYAEMSNADGSQKGNIAAYQDRLGHGLTVSYTGVQDQIDNARKGYSVALVWANEAETGGTKLWDAATTTQNAQGGGYSTPTSHALPAAQFIRRALDEVVIPTPETPSYLSDPYYDSVVAFEGAMGYGANATGGRGNGTNGNTQLVFVDNLNDSGTGSLRAALTATGKRVIVPRVAGYVNLSTEIIVNSTMGNFTFLGQLAPGGGLGVKPSVNPSWKMSLVTLNATPNVIMRYLSMRMGETRGDSTCAYLSNQCYNSSKPLRVLSVQDGIFDHISAAFGTDGNIDIGGSTMERVTLQNSILTHPLANAGHYEGDHAFNTLNARGSNLSILYNLYANSKERNPDIGNYPKTQFIGNTIHNTQQGSFVYTGYSDQDTQAEIPAVDYRRNTHVAGPLNHPTDEDLRIRNISLVPGLTPKIYLEGNVSPDITDYSTIAGQKGIIRWFDPQTIGPDGTDVDDWVVTTSVGTPDIMLLDAGNSFNYVMANAGNNRTRDSLDTFAVNTAQGIGSSISSRPETVSGAGGYPTISINTYPTANSDGIPTSWRTAKGESRSWYELDTGGTGRMIIENYADDVAQGRFTP